MTIPSNNLTVLKCQILAHARLHMGFYDLSFKADQQQFGSVGLSLQAPTLSLELGIGDTESSPELLTLLQKASTAFDITMPIYAKLQQAIPRHAGLGSGTQMALALAAGLNQLTNIGVEIIAHEFNRGARSGIGIGAFAQGGFLVDAGKQKSAFPSIIERMDFPQDWRILLVSDDSQVGVHGASEKLAFSNLPQVKNNMQDIVFKGLLPAVKRKDLLAFGTYMQDLQAYNGDYFAPVQGGHYASTRVEKTLNWLRENGVACIGQSSWGPTGFAIVESETVANQLKTAFETEFGLSKPLSMLITSACNTGATIKDIK
jgi:beta-ribofuranosylaminobenzene 5'-phosphate synthase